MDNEEARFLLGACQPSGKDAGRPEITDALAQAQRDPELGAWIARERSSDAAIARRLRELEPPAALRARLLAGGRASRPVRGWRRWRVVVGMAATIALAAGAGWWTHARFFTSAEEPVSLLAWQRDCVSVFANPFFGLDLERDTYAPLAAHLAAKGLPIVSELPFTDAIVSAVGCKVLAWRGAAVSLTCFRADSGELVHLFVVPRGEFDDAQLRHGPHREQVGSFATVTWARDHLVVMVASKLPPEPLGRTLRREGLAFTAQPPGLSDHG